MGKEIKTMPGKNGGTLRVGGDGSGGRPPLVFSQIIKEWEASGYEKATRGMVEGIFSFLLALPMNKVTEIAGDIGDTANEYPALMRITAKYMIDETKSKEMLIEMLDRANGKPQKSVDVTSSGENVSGFMSLPLEVRLKIMEIIEEQA